MFLIIIPISFFFAFVLTKDALKNDDDVQF